MKRKSMLALLLAVSMTCSMTAATGTVALCMRTQLQKNPPTTAAATDDAEATDDSRRS